MTLSEYEALVGITVPVADQAKVTATIARTQTMLESLLGFTLDPTKVDENLYNELGKTVQDCFCPSVSLENLQDPDAVVGAYRLYRYNDLDKYFHIDPFSRVNAVKLVFIKEGTGTNGITIKTFDWDDIRIQYGRDNIGRFIEYCQDCLCDCKCDDCVQLAVDAEWLWTEGNIPADLNYVWSDMITFYSDTNSEDIKSESIDTHSYTRADNTPPEQRPRNLAILRKYAGPYGSVAVMPV